MGPRIRLNTNNIINLLTVLLICSFVVFTSYSWGRYVVFGCTFLIFFVQGLRDGGKYSLRFPVMFVIMFVFALYSFTSSVWAERPSDSITIAKTLFETLLMIYIVYNCYRDGAHNISDLLKCIKWAGYVISIYTILYYGFDSLVMTAINEVRLDNSYANVNTIGMLSAICVVIQIDEFIREKSWKWGALFCIPAIFIVALTQSRKALLVVVFGILLCFLLHNLESKNLKKTIAKLLIIVPVTVILLQLLVYMPIFSGAMERMDALLAGIMGEGRADSSTLIRNRMIEIGWEQFLETPLGGMGMANPHILSQVHLRTDAYLHNNFIELLAGGGIIGFAIYYSMYVYVFVMLWKFRQHKNKEYFICLIMAMILLVLDYGMVSYYQKIRYVYLLVLFLEIDALKKKARQ